MGWDEGGLVWDKGGLGWDGGGLVWDKGGLGRGRVGVGRGRTVLLQRWMRRSRPSPSLLCVPGTRRQNFTLLAHSLDVKAASLCVFQLEVSQLEGSLQQPKAQSAMSPYLVLDAQALCQHLAVVKQLAGSGRFIIIIPRAGEGALRASPPARVEAHGGHSPPP